MKRWSIWLLCLLFSLFFLNSCGKTEGADASQVESMSMSNPVVGGWTLIRMSYNGIDVEKEELDEIGTSLTLELLEDGTGTMDFDGEISELTWDENSITVDEVPNSYTLSDDLLILAEEGTEMVFAKTESLGAASDAFANGDFDDFDEDDSPAEEITAASADEQITVVPAAYAQELVPYSCSDFSMQIPQGWTVEAAPTAAGMFHVLRAYDPECPVNQILFQIKYQPLFPSEDARAFMAVNSPNMQRCPVLYDVSTEGFFAVFSDYAASFGLEPVLSAFRMPDIQNFAVQESFAGNGQMSSVAVSSNVVRATFTQDGAEGEGMFSVELVPFAIESGFGYYMAYSIVAVTAEKDSFQDWEDVLSRSLGSIDYSQEFVSYAMAQSDQTVTTSQQLSQAADAMQDSIMSSWENRNRSQDIMSQKQSDATLGYERVVDVETGEIYKAENGFTDWYDGERYKPITDDQYTEGVAGEIVRKY